MSAIIVDQINKSFKFSVSQGIKGWFQPEKKIVNAVNDISFMVNSGESLAFIGPNGAGKSTTIKMLTGILRPTSGSVRVLGLEPLAQRRDLALRIGTVFGQRSQLIFNLPLTDSFRLTAKMYRLSPVKAKSRIETLVKQFALEEFLDQPVRKLSLGQRMRAEVANSLLHEPEIIFLDEPTIGLDVVAKRSLRKMIRSVNQELGTTIFLTSHDVGDIEEVCDRTIVVNNGRIIQDSKTAEMAKEYLTHKYFSVLPKHELSEGVTVAGVPASVRDGKLFFEVDTAVIETADFLRQLVQDIDIQDVNIEEPPLEQIIHELYLKGEHVVK